MAAASFVMIRVNLQDSDLWQENTASGDVLMSHDCTHAYVPGSSDLGLQNPGKPNPLLLIP